MVSNTQDDGPAVAQFLEAAIQQVATALSVFAKPNQDVANQVATQMDRLQHEADHLSRQDLASLAGHAAEAARSWGATPGGDPRIFLQRVYYFGTSLLDELLRNAILANAKGNKIDYRMVVVDDSRVSAEALANTFASAGFSVRIAKTMQEVQDQFRSFEPNILVSDVRMPDLDVTDLCARFRLAVGLEKCVVVLVSGGSESELRDRLDIIKPDAFVSKVTGAANVLSTVQKVCSEKLG